MNSRIVGRDGELAIARAFLDVREGARGLLVEGESGIGKTAVWVAVMECAASLGYRVLSCVGAQAEGHRRPSVTSTRATGLAPGRYWRVC